MAHKEKTMFCNYCEGYVIAKKKRINHPLHLVMSVITGGLWLGVYFLVFLFNWPSPHKWQCGRCGMACVT